MAPSKRIHWNEREWFDVMSAAIPERDRTGKSLAGIVHVMQRKVLPKVRWRNVASLGSGGLPVLRDYEARFRAGWVPEGRHGEPTKPEIERRPLGTQRDRDEALEATFTSTQRVYWTAREWAMMACAVKWKTDHGDARALPRVFFETQAQVLPLDRCKRLTSLSALPALQKAYDEAIPNIWTLPPDIRAKCEGRGAEYEAQLAKSAAGILTAPVPEVIPDAVSTEPANAPGYFHLSAPLAAAAADPLGARIAAILADAGGRIAAETRAFMVTQYESQLDRLVVALAASLKEHVHALVASELGPLTTPPPAAPAAPVPPTPSETPPSDPTPDAKAAPRLRVDIVGLIGNGLGEVRQAASRLGLDARFIEIDHARAWMPGPNVILSTKFINHAAQFRAQKAGSQIMYANAGPQSVIGILESLAEHRGALQ